MLEDVGGCWRMLAMFLPLCACPFLCVPVPSLCACASSVSRFGHELLVRHARQTQPDARADLGSMPIYAHA